MPINKNKLLLLLIFLFLSLAGKASAVCPVCTVAVGAGVGLARYFGIEDTITGVWIGGLIISLSLWTIDWLEKKNCLASQDLAKPEKLRLRNILIVLGYYLITIVPLFWKGVIGHPLNKMCGMDKILLGTLVGSAGFALGAVAHFKLKKKNNDRVYFPFQKVVFSIAPLLILSLMFYIISKC
jgi:hypothetical protein